MPTLSLQNICYTQLGPMTWCATASIASPILPNLRSGSCYAVIPSHTCSHPMNMHSLLWQIYNDHRPLSAREVAQSRRQQQRKGVRLLLQYLLAKLAIVDTLDELKFPYRLINSGYYVCFSHSGCHHLDSSHLDNNNSKSNNLEIDHLKTSQLNDKVAVVISCHRATGIDIETQDITWQVAQRFYHPAEITMLASLPNAQRCIASKWLWQIKESLIKIYQYKLAQGLRMNYAPIISEIVTILNQDEHSPILIKNTQSGYQIAILQKQQTIIVF